MLYLDAGVAGLGLGLYAVLSALSVRAGPSVSALIRDDGGDRVRRVRLDEEAVQGGRRALRDGGGLMRRVGLVRVSAVDHSALRDVDAGSAAHRSAQHPEERISAGPPVHWPVVAPLGPALPSRRNEEEIHVHGTADLRMTLLIR